MPSRQAAAQLTSPSGPRRPRILVAGVSADQVCGVRDQAAVLSGALANAGADISTAWGPDSNGEAPDLEELARQIGQSVREHRAEAVLLHYSVFAFSRRGVPLGVPGLAARLRKLRVPLLIFAHELACPWADRGWRGAMQAATQRAALLPLLSVAARVFVTTPERVEWLTARRWLLWCPATFVPIASNIAPHPSSEGVSPVRGRIGLFSFSDRALAADLLVGAVADAARSTGLAQLVLIGGPGPDSPAAERWRAAASAVGCSLTFTGTATEAEVSRQLAACEVVVLPDPGGPSPRKSSLAAALAHGRPVLALDGPNTWQEFIDSAAVEVADASRNAFAAALDQLLREADRREALGARAKSFYESTLAVEAAAQVVLKDIITAGGECGARCCTPP